MRRWICILCLLLLFPIHGSAEGQEKELQTMTDEILDSYTEFYGEAFSKGVERAGLSDAFTDLIPRFRFRDLLSQLMQGKLEASPSDLLSWLLRWLLGEVCRSLKLMVTVLAAAVLCSYLTGLYEGFGKTGVTQAAYYVCYIVIAGVAAAAFYDAADCVSSAIESIALFMKMVVPIVITTLVASGAMISASVFEPALLGMIAAAVTVIRTLLIPLVMIATALNLVNGISDQFKIDRLIKLINQCIKWGLSIMLTIFVSTAAIQSIASAGADGLTVKLTKFATANLIPVVGGIMAESVETVMNCSVLIKNSVGVLGILCLVVIALSPLCKTAAVLLIFRLTAAAAEPVSDARIVNCLSSLANAVSVLFSMLAATTVMFVIVLTIVIHAGNTAIVLGR